MSATVISLADYLAAKAAANAPKAANGAPLHPHLADLGGRYNYAVGNKYDRNLSKKDIAAKIRADIKDAVKAGALPKGKYSVRFDRFAGGCSIDVTVKDLDPGFALYSVERVLAEKAEPHKFIPDCHCPIYTPEGKAMMDLLKEIHGAYNYDRSDIMTDYFDVLYYGSISVDWVYEKNAKEAILAAAVALVEAAK